MQTLNRKSTWLLILLFILITLFQYAESLALPSFLAHANENLGLTRYSLERILYLLPIIWAGILFGWRGGIVVSVMAVASMLPRGIFISPNPEDAIVESVAIFIVGNTVAVALESLRKERERRAELEIAQHELESQLRIIEEDERRLAALNQTSSIISQSLELSEVLNSAISCVMGVMGIEVIRIYILDENRQELELAAHGGVTQEFVENIGRIRLGEGFNGRVALTGQPMLVKDASEMPELSSLVVREENIRSQVIVPMMSKGKVVGTISVAMHSFRKFVPEEVDLLTAIANQIGVAVDHARLYLHECEASEELRASEERYRGLFENAHDAIWLHDLEDNIIDANTACVDLTGYTKEELLGLKADRLVSDDSKEVTLKLEQRLLNEQASGTREELKLRRRDGSEAIIQLVSNLMFNSGHPVAIQHIARDVTEEKRMHENLQFFIHQITRAQEEERKRISQELHDETVQSMVVHAREIEALSLKVKQLNGTDITLDLEALYEQANYIMNGVRRLSQDLRPAALDRLGLVSAVEWIGDRITEYSGIQVEVEFVGEERRLPDEVELVLFRITQEALRNVWKHADAHHAEVHVEFDDTSIRIEITDDGKGFVPPASVADLPRYGMLGLAGMQERVRLIDGVLSVNSEPGKGTRIVAELPV